MIQKNDITKYVMENCGVETTPKSLNLYNTIMWQNTRKKVTGGLRLTSTGFQLLERSGLKSYSILFQKKPIVNNQLLIRLDNFIDCPWYMTNKEIVVFSEKMAIQLALFSGNVERFGAARAGKPQIVVDTQH